SSASLALNTPPSGATGATGGVGAAVASVARSSTAVARAAPSRMRRGSRLARDGRGSIIITSVRFVRWRLRGLGGRRRFGNVDVLLVGRRLQDGGARRGALARVAHRPVQRERRRERHRRAGGGRARQEGE